MEYVSEISSTECTGETTDFPSDTLSASTSLDSWVSFPQLGFDKKIH